MRTLFFFSAAVLLLAGVTVGQDGPIGSGVIADQGRAAPTGRSYYSSQRASARMAVQQRAAWRAAQRMQRLEMYDWAGYSPLRPPASPYAMMGSHPSWLGPVVYYQYPGVFYPRYSTGVR